MFYLRNDQHSIAIKEYLDSHLLNKPPDCILYSEDGVEYKIHKELFGQTKSMRKLLKSANCCDTTEIIFPCSQEELSQLIDFVIIGKIQCKDEIESLKVFENLNKNLMGSFYGNGGYGQGYGADSHVGTCCVIG